MYVVYSISSMYVVYILEYSSSNSNNNKVDIVIPFNISGKQNMDSFTNYLNFTYFVSDETKRQTNELDSRVTVSHLISPDGSVHFGHVLCLIFLGKKFIFLLLPHSLLLVFFFLLLLFLLFVVCLAMPAACRSSHVRY